MKTAVLGLLRFYKKRISPQLPPACRYTPTCSEYAIEAIERRGVIIGGLLAAKRVLSCNPFSRGGYDPVPGGRDPRSASGASGGRAR
jgi:putative membrane protein insertion efficiency factor